MRPAILGCFPPIESSNLAYKEKGICDCFVSVVCAVGVDSSPPLENTTETPLGTCTQKHVCPRHHHVGPAHIYFAEEVSSWYSMQIFVFGKVYACWPDVGVARTHMLLCAGTQGGLCSVFQRGRAIYSYSTHNTDRTAFLCIP